MTVAWPWGRPRWLPGGWRCRLVTRFSFWRDWLSIANLLIIAFGLFMAMSTAGWYVLDTAISLYHGVFFNAALNTLILVLILLPLGFTRQAFFERSLVD